MNLTKEQFAMMHIFQPSRVLEFDASETWCDGRIILYFIDIMLGV
jgi:hypothetical protein